MAGDGVVREGVVEADVPLSGGLMNHSSSPALIRAAGMFFKWGFMLAVFIGGGFMAIRYLIPILQEMRSPTKSGTVDKKASVAVQALQQTRAVVAKSDANVSHLNEVLGIIESPKVVAAPPPPPPPPVKPKRAPVASAGKVDLILFQEAVARLKVGGVLEGAVPRIYLNDRIVTYGEIIDKDLGLRFMGVDVKENAVLFTNADNVVFRKYY